MSTRLSILRRLAALVCLCMVVTSFGTAAFAADTPQKAINHDANAVNAWNQNLLSYDPSADVSPATLLTGTNGLVTKSGALADTIKAYENTYLLGVAADFCVFLEEDFIVYDSDAEGRVAVGRDIVINTPWGNYSIGAGDFVTHASLDELLRDRKGAATIIIGRNLTGTWLSGKQRLNDVYYENGNKYEADTGDAQKPTKKSTKKIVLNRTQSTIPGLWDPLAPSIPVEHGPTEYQQIDQRQTYVTPLLDFASIFSKDLTDISQLLVQQASDTQSPSDTTIASGTYSGSPSITFRYNGPKDDAKECVYFTLSEEDFEKFQNAYYIFFEDIPKLPSKDGREVVLNDGSIGKWDTSYIIINVAGKEIDFSDEEVNRSKATVINGMNISKDNVPGVQGKNENNDPGVSSILYNFYEAEKIVLGNNFQGTVFAPKADVTDVYATTIKDAVAEQKWGDPPYDSYNVGDAVSNTLQSLSGQLGNYRGHLSGALIAKSFEGGTEFGYRPFSGGTEIINGSLQIFKSVQGVGSDPDKLFHFTVELNPAPKDGVYGDMEFKNGKADVYLKDGETAIAKDLRAATKYKVTEESSSGYTVGVIGATGNFKEGSIQAGEIEEANFINVYHSGDIKVTKSVASTGADTQKEFQFTLTLSDTSVNGIHGDMFFRKGVAEFTLRHGQSKTATHLPAGVTYSVVEKSDKAYTITKKTNAEGTVVENVTIASEFVNAYTNGVNVPKTGDSFSPLLWLGLMAVALAGLVLLAGSRWKGRRN